MSDNPETSLYQLYKIDQIDLVTPFLKKHPYLIGILFEAYKHIQAIFGQHLVKVSLEVVIDPEEDYEGLFATVYTNLSPEQSLDLLDKFDEEWFLNNIDAEIGSIFTVSVRPI